MAQSLSHPEERTPHPSDTPGAASDPHHHHVPGSMDITEQERTFERFMRFVMRTSIAIVALLILLALING